MRRKHRPYGEIHKTKNGIIYKLCSDCDEWKPMNEDFYQNKSAPDGHNPYCKVCTSKRSSQYQKDNPEWTKSYTKTIYRRKEQYFKDKAKRWSDENEDRSKSLQKDWRQNNPKRLKDYREDRLFHKKHDISDEEWERCKEYFNNECAYCGITENEAETKYKNKLHKDHANPNGENDISNCIPACKLCNSSKHDSELDVWFNESNSKYTYKRKDKIYKWLQGDYTLVTT